MEMKRNVIKVIRNGALKSAAGSTSKTCLWFCYQPKAPKNINILKNK